MDDIIDRKGERKREECMIEPTTETIFGAPQGQLQLRRFPRRDREPLRAWDAADEYLLQHLHDAPGADDGATWIVNDSFGALTVALAALGRPVYMSSDSWLSHEGTRANLRDNGVAAETSVQLLDSLASPAAAVATVLVKIPKNLVLLEDQLHRIRPHIRQGVRILGAGMTRVIHTSTLSLFEKILGPTTTTLARRKARLVLCEFDETLDPGPTPYPTQYQCTEAEWSLSNHAGVFSHERLDAGTCQLLKQIPANATAQHIVDLGCGNGVVGLSAARRNPTATLTFIDESFRAVASAQHNWQALFGDSRPAVFEVGDGLASVAAASADVILCNPPFHQSNAMSDATAWRMFTGARRALCSGGTLLIVGNRHLAYHAKLRRLFGHCEVLHSDSKFVVLSSRSR
jgi:23S rRNA (guanine1835-N2)-methyltransferase